MSEVKGRKPWNQKVIFDVVTQNYVANLIHLHLTVERLHSNLIKLISFDA